MKMLIDSKWVDSSNGSVGKVVNSANNSVIDTVPSATESDLKRAVKAAQDAKIRMAKLPAHEKATILVRCADVMEKKRNELSSLLASENGKPIRQTREELAAAIRIFRGFGEEAKRLFGKSMSLDMVPGMERHFALTLRRPIGVVAAIVPFNYPVELYAHKAAAALAAGNAVIVKPPSDCPLTLLRIAEILEEVGVPRAAHQVVTGTGQVVGELLATEEGVDLISLTGSTAAGQRISRLAAETLKKVHLELGGNDATIVCSDADLKEATEAVILGRLARGNGQICCAVKRVFVDEAVHDEFIEILSDKTKKLIVGDPLDEQTDVGPLITESAAREVENDIIDAVNRGAKIRAGGERKGAFIDPTVLEKVPLNAKVMREENFGPVVPVVSFRTIEEVIELANATPYGLQSSVFTNNIATALDMAYRLDVGGVIVNWSSAVRVENLPFGGVKMSGHGRESLHDTLLEMTEQKTVILYNALSFFDGTC
ncbi:MAG: aldehyde dehydrogenase family protein [Deltaproteobacteria bacterium]|nr:aldehyde dehydrogenase family protein [Deltaproteobacteria bacterium]